MGLLKSASSSFSAKALSSIFTVPGLIVLTQLVGSSVLGQYFLIVATLNLLSILTDFGIGSGIVRYEREEGTGQFFTAGLLSRIVIVSIVSAGIILIGSELHSYYGFSFEIYLISMFAVEQVRGVLGHIMVAENRVGTASWIQTSGAIFKIMAQIALVVALGASPVLLIVGHVISSVLLGILSVYVIDTVPTIPTYSEMSKLFKFGVRDYFSGIEEFGAEWIDSLLIGAFMSPSAVGIYEITWSVSRNLYKVSDAVSKSLYPRLVEAVSNHSVDEVERLLYRSFTYVPIFVFPGFVGFLLLGEEILSLYGKEFVTGYSVTLVLIAARLFQGIDSVFKSLFRARTIPFQRARFSPIIVLTNIAVGLVLIPRLGILGAGTATMISFIIGPLIGLSKFGFRYRTITSRWGRQVIASIGMGVAVLMLQNVLGAGILQLILQILFGAVTYAVLLYLIDQKLVSAVIASIIS